jgi:hypothetical protein
LLCPDYASLEGVGARSSAQAPAVATAQTGSMVMRKGRSVSLAECDVRSKAAKTNILPTSRTANAAMTPTMLSARMLQPPEDICDAVPSLAR